MALSTAQLEEVQLADAQVWADSQAQAVLNAQGDNAIIKLRPVAGALSGMGQYDEAVALYTIHLVRRRFPHLAQGGGETTNISDGSGSSRSTTALRIPPGMPLDLHKTTAGQALIGILSLITRGPVVCY